MFSYAWPRPAVTVDVVLAGLGVSDLEILLILRRQDPYAGRWALPGGFVDEHEPLEAAARRELLEETGLRAGTLVQVGAYGEPGRDPRGHTVGVGYVGAGRLAAMARGVRAGDDAEGARFWPVSGLPPLAFDHADIVRDALALFVADVRRGGPALRDLLPRGATPSEREKARRRLLRRPWVRTVLRLPGVHA